MFCVEIAFKDSSLGIETLIVKRVAFTLGGKKSHVSIDDLNSLGYSYKFVRQAGRSFVFTKVDDNGKPIDNEETKQLNQITLDTSTALITVLTLDIDLTKKESEPPDRAGVRLLKRALSLPIPKEISIEIEPGNLSVSIAKDEPVMLGRGKTNHIRLENDDISTVHAQCGFQDGTFWIEDLGSTNGTFIDGKQISGRAAFNVGQSIVLGREVKIRGRIEKSIEVENRLARSEETNTADQISSKGAIINGSNQNGRERRLSLVKPVTAHQVDSNAVVTATQSFEEYPALVSLSPVARPQRVVLQGSKVVKIGRDPSCEMWIGAPHVSRLHCSFQSRGEFEVVASDSSTNGTSYGSGILKKGDSLQIKENPVIFDFGGGVTVMVCFNKEQEDKFIQSGGSPDVFLRSTNTIDNNVANQLSGLKRLSRQLTARIDQGERKDIYTDVLNSTKITPKNSQKQQLTVKMIIIFGTIAVILGVFVAVVGSLLVSLT